ncbi:hypothetical protein TUBRATIS_21730 [Tubulinosema ratisbonensis]|uniref:Uncharacterized protein n=1 Tax=Tubulinosema ratisbonensis TaxID=291195 RepID=A0A437AJZ3_9MICR|nr:hypothetical protein TUBRATIS_21730 [Tubulinosema ratisbonensis]
MQIIFSLLIKTVFICTSEDFYFPAFPGQIFGTISMQTSVGSLYSLPVTNLQPYQQTLMPVPLQMVYLSYNYPPIPNLPIWQGHINPHGPMTLIYPTHNMIPRRTFSQDMTGYETINPQTLNAHPSLPANSSYLSPTEIKHNNPGIDLCTFKRMIRNITLDTKIFEDPLNIFSPKFKRPIRIFCNIDVFYRKILDFLTKRRTSNDRIKPVFIPPETIVEEIFRQLQNDQVQIGMFFFLYSFISRDFTSHGRCIQIIDDKLVFGRNKESVMNLKTLILELEQWKRLNFKAKTYNEAWDILYEIGNLISLSSTEESRLQYLKGFRSNLYCIMKTIWIDD